MSKFCARCGAALSQESAFCPGCGKPQGDTPLQDDVYEKKGPLTLPRNGLSLTAVILVLTGAIFSNINWVATVIQDPLQVVGILWSAEVFIIFAMAATLFIGYFTRIPLKIPMLMWGAAALFGFASNLAAAIKLWPTKLAAGKIGTFYFILGLLTAAAALFAILYVLKAFKKIPALVVLGVLLTIVFIMSVVFDIKSLAGYLRVNDKNAMVIAQTLFGLLHALIFPVGIFLTVLSAKEKPTKLC